MKPIDTNTRRPKENEQVLAYYSNEGWKFAAIADDGAWRPAPSGEVTHWMPVPDAPTTKRKGAYTPDFEQAFRLYDRKGSKAKAFKYWQMLSQEDRRAVLKAIPEYCQRYSGPDFQYRKDFDGWINPDERRWERPIADPGYGKQPVRMGWHTPN